jgi:hypothetical protein
MQALEDLSDLMIIDEIQRKPELFELLPFSSQPVEKSTGELCLRYL